jgi:hypothetical protein
MDTTAKPGVTVVWILMMREKPRRATTDGAATRAAARKETRPDQSVSRSGQTPRCRPAVTLPADRLLATASLHHHRGWKPGRTPPRPQSTVEEGRRRHATKALPDSASSDGDGGRRTHRGGQEGPPAATLARSGAVTLGWREVRVGGLPCIYMHDQTTKRTTDYQSRAAYFKKKKSVQGRDQFFSSLCLKIFLVPNN